MHGPRRRCTWIANKSVAHGSSSDRSYIRRITSGDERLLKRVETLCRASARNKVTDGVQNAGILLACSPLFAFFSVSSKERLRWAESPVWLAGVPFLSSDLRILGAAFDIAVGNCRRRLYRSVNLRGYVYRLMLYVWTCARVSRDWRILLDEVRLLSDMHCSLRVVARFWLGHWMNLDREFRDHYGIHGERRKGEIIQ